MHIHRIITSIHTHQLNHINQTIVLKVDSGILLFPLFQPLIECFVQTVQSTFTQSVAEGTALISISCIMQHSIVQYSTKQVIVQYSLAQYSISIALLYYSIVQNRIVYNILQYSVAYMSSLLTMISDQITYQCICRFQSIAHTHRRILFFRCDLQSAIRQLD